MKIIQRRNFPRIIRSMTCQMYFQDWTYMQNKRSTININLWMSMVATQAASSTSIKARKTCPPCGRWPAIRVIKAFSGQMHYTRISSTGKIGSKRIPRSRGPRVSSDWIKSLIYLRNRNWRRKLNTRLTLFRKWRSIRIMNPTWRTNSRCKNNKI